MANPPSSFATVVAALAGNGFVTGDVVWLERARGFAMHAIGGAATGSCGRRSGARCEPATPET